jgi:alpha-L-fucosidase
MWYSERELVTMFVQCITKGGNLLWNVGPRASGELPRLYKQRTAWLGSWVRRNRRAIDRLEPVPYEFAYGGVLARRGNCIYLFFLYWPGEEFSLPGFNERLLSARLVDGDQEVEAVQEPHRIVFRNMPRKAPDLCTVVELTFDAPPTAHPWAACRLHNYPMPPMADWVKL